MGADASALKNIPFFHPGGAAGMAGEQAGVVNMDKDEEAHSPLGLGGLLGGLFGKGGGNGGNSGGSGKDDQNDNTLFWILVIGGAALAGLIVLVILLKK